MDSKKLMLVLAVVVVAVVAVAAVALTMGGEEEDDVVEQYPIEDTTIGDLVVFGNANNDIVVDQDDIDYVKKVMKGEAPRTLFCDANHDNMVDEKDIEQIEDMIAGKNGTVVWYIDAMKAERSIDWPVNRVIALSNSPQIMALSVGLDKKVVAISKEDKFLYQNFTNAKLISAGLEDYETIFSFSPDVVVVGNSHGGGEDELQNPELLKQYANRGIALYSTYNMDGEKSASSALTLGYLCQSFEKANQYYDWCNGINDAISSKVATLKDADKKTGMVIFGGRAVSGLGYDYTKALEAAGGVNVVTDFEGYKMFSDDNISFVFNYHPDIVFRIATIGYGNIVNDADAGLEKYQIHYDKFKPMETVKNGNLYLIDFSLPQTLRIAYMAEVMYPDLFGEGFADKWHQDLLDIYGIDFKVDGQFLVTYDEFMAGKA